MKGAPDCISARCGMDAGCRKVDDNSFICICTHDLSLEQPGKPCPRNVVSSGTTNTRFPDGRSKGRLTIHKNRIYFNQSMANNMSTPLTGLGAEDVPASETSLATTLAWVIPVTSIVALIFFIFSILLLRHFRIHRMTHRKRTISRLSTNILAPDFYTDNANYSQVDCVTNPSVNTGTSVSRFLLREWIELQEEIGEGCFGKIFRGRLRHPDLPSLPPDPAYINLESGEAVAVKILKPPSYGISSTIAQKDLLREAKIMSKFSHENILSLRGIVINEFCVGPWIVFEYMEFGDLSHLLRSTNSVLSANRSSNQVDLHVIASQIADGMQYLSSRNFVHRDLACRNCLVGKRPSAPVQAHSAPGKGQLDLIVKISDFGMSRDIHANDYYKTKGSKLLPVRWMAPESIVFGKFTPESDVWSFGVVLWEIFSMGALPYYGHTNEEVIKMVADGVQLQPRKSTPTQISQLMIDGCWQASPSDRFTFSNIHDKLVSLITLCNSHVAFDYYLQPLPD